MNGKMTQKLGLGFGFTKKACFVCGSYSHLIKDCDFHEKRMANKSVLKDMGKDTGHREVRPCCQASSLRAATSTSAVKPVNTVTKRNQVNVSKSRTNTFHKSHSPIRRSFYKSTAPNTRISNEKVNAVRVNGVNTAGQAAVSAVEGKGVTVVKASAGNKDFLTDYQDIDGGFVAFGGGTRGGKQHKASCKDKLVSSISQPLQMLHMDLFGPTSVRSINHKTYCLVQTDDFSREMNEFCDQKGIKREFRVARTSKQNRVAKRNNRTLIEATRTMLADLLLPTIFWAEAVNTACYVLNRVLVTKPHNKTPYELIIGRPSSISFMILFRCPVIILNTLDPLGKFDGKADEGFLVRYSVNSKAPRVFNTETRKVEENLHVNFLENEPNVAGQGPNWLFDIDSLTNSINYQPVTAGNQTDKNEGPQETNCDTGLKKNVDAGQSEEENSSDEKDKDDTADDAAGKKIVQEPASENEQALQNVLDKMMDQEKEATVQSDVVRKEFEAQFNAASASRTFGDAGPSFIPLEADFNNMEPSTVVSPIPTTRVHTIYPKGQIIGDPKSAVQIRGMTKKSSGEQALISYIQTQQRTNHKDY
ncbi:putative ribonuclease H-like domain-containing protein [Tanacetum coccineum]